MIDLQIVINKVTSLSPEDEFQVYFIYKSILFQTKCHADVWMSSLGNPQIKTLNSPFLRKKTLLVIYKQNTLPLFI